MRIAADPRLPDCLFGLVFGDQFVCATPLRTVSAPDESLEPQAGMSAQL
jgi:hypothetical protein